MNALASLSWFAYGVLLNDWFLKVRLSGDTTPCRMTGLITSAYSGRDCVKSLRSSYTSRERQFFTDNLLVRIPFIIVMIRWTGLAPWEIEFPFRAGTARRLPISCSDTSS